MITFSAAIAWNAPPGAETLRVDQSPNTHWFPITFDSIGGPGNTVLTTHAVAGNPGYTPPAGVDYTGVPDCLHDAFDAPIAPFANFPVTFL